MNAPNIKQVAAAALSSIDAVLIPALDDADKPAYLDDGNRATHTEYYVLPETFKAEVVQRV